MNKYITTRVCLISFGLLLEFNSSSLAYQTRSTLSTFKLIGKCNRCPFLKVQLRVYPDIFLGHYD